MNATAEEAVLASGNRSGRVAPILAAIVAMAVVMFGYWWSVRAVAGLGSGLDREPPANDYYNHLVAGFVQGHLYMDLPVSPALQALPDPYDPRQNEPYRVTDASYYRGHYYLYFGVGPAVTLLLPFRLITGAFLPTPWAILIFSWIGFAAMSWVFLAVRRRYFPASPAWTAPAGVLTLGIGSTVDVLLRRPFFWELATAGGFAFAMLALGSLYGTLHSARRATWWMAAAGLFLGLAVASRPTYVYAIPLLLVPLFARPRGTQRRRRDTEPGVTGASRLQWELSEHWRMAVAGGATLGAVGVGVFWYNHARFGNGFEFGHNYLLSVAYESKVRLFGWDYFWFNARMYFLRLGAWSWQPPFFAPVPVARADMPAGFYTVDDPFGLIPVFPIALLALLAPWALRQRMERERTLLRAFLTATALLCVSAAVVILLYVATIPRYAVDFLPALAVLTAIGVLVAANSHRRWARIATLLVTTASLAIGGIVFFDLGRLLDRTQPELIARVTAVTTRLELAFDRLRGVRYGPVSLTVKLPSADKRVVTLLSKSSGLTTDRVLIERRGDQEYRFGVQHAAASILWGGTVRLAAGDAHALTVSLGSFYPELEHGFFAGVDYATATWLQHHAAITVDGPTVLSTFAPFHSDRRGWTDVVSSPTASSLMQLPSDPRHARLEPVPNIFISLNVPHGTEHRRVSLANARTDRGTDTLALELSGKGDARLVYQHGSEPEQHADSFALSAGTHRVELRSTENGWAPPADAPIRVIAWIDGVRRCDFVVPAFGAPPDAVRFAESAVDAKFLLGAPDATRRGGALLLRTVLPKGVKNAWIPLLSTGHAGAADVLSLDYMSVDAVQPRFDHWGAPLVVGKTIQLDEAVAHDIEVWLPSFATDAFGQPGTGEVVVKIDGQEALRVPATVYGFAPTELVLGENRLRATMDDRYFRGAFVQQVWLGR